METVLEADLYAENESDLGLSPGADKTLVVDLESLETLVVGPDGGRGRRAGTCGVEPDHTKFN